MNKVINRYEDVKAKILIVDDSPETIDVLHSILPKNIKRQIALNGIYAIKLLNKTYDLPDLILLDILMPGMNGYDVCKEIKKEDKLKEIPIIFISSLNETFDKVKAFEAGAVDYIIKPFQREEVMARINAHLEVYNSRKVVKDLYSKTIQGITGAMNDMLAIANPEVGKLSNGMRLYSEMIMQELGIEDQWDLKLACVMSELGMLFENMNKQTVNDIIHPEEQNVYEEIDKAYKSLDLSNDIVARIPKFEDITSIIEKSKEELEKQYRNTSAKDMEPVVLKGQILRILIFYLYKLEKEKNSMEILEEMKTSTKEFYSFDVLEALTKVQNDLINGTMLNLRIEELRPKMILVDDLSYPNGRILLKSGYELSQEMIMLIGNFKELASMKLRVIVK